MGVREKGKMLMQRWSKCNTGSFHLSIFPLVPLSPTYFPQHIFVNKIHYFVKFSFQRLYTVFWDWLRTLLGLGILLSISFQLYLVVSISLCYFYIIISLVFYFGMCWLIFECLLLWALPTDSVLDIFMFKFFSSFTNFWLGVGWIMAVMN